MKPTLLVAVGCWALAACGGTQRPITIAAAGPWAERYGEMARQGAELAVAELNDAGGIDGRPVRLLERDDKGDGARAAEVAQELVANADVIAVVGHVTSGAMVSAAKVYDGNLAAIATSATTPDLTGISRWVFRVSSSDSINGQEIARFATALGRKRAAIIYENDSYGRGLAEAFRRGFPGEIVAVDPIAADPGDLEPYIAWYKRRAPDVVVGIGVETSGLALLREAHRQGLNAAFIGGDGWTGIITDTVAAEGAYVGTPFTVADPRAEVQRFVDAFQRRFGRLPDSDAALAYDATRLIAAAIRERGADRAAVRDYLATFSTRAAFHGVTGEIRFRADGDRERSAYVMTRVRRGWLVPAREMGR